MGYEKEELKNKKRNFRNKNAYRARGGEPCRVTKVPTGFSLGLLWPLLGLSSGLSWGSLGAANPCIGTILSLLRLSWALLGLSWALLGSLKVGFIEVKRWVMKRRN